MHRLMLVPLRLRSLPETKKAFDILGSAVILVYFSGLTFPYSKFATIPCKEWIYNYLAGT